MEVCPATYFVILGGTELKRGIGVGVGVGVGP